MSQGRKRGRTDRSGPDPHRRQALERAASRGAARTRCEDREGLREIRGRDAEELRHAAQRRAVRVARPLPGEPQVKPYLRHPFWQAVGLLIIAYIIVVFVIPMLPGSAIVPKRVVLQY